MLNFRYEYLETKHNIKQTTQRIKANNTIKVNKQIFSNK